MTILIDWILGDAKNLCHLVFDGNKPWSPPSPTSGGSSAYASSRLCLHWPGKLAFLLMLAIISFKSATSPLKTRAGAVLMQLLGVLDIYEVLIQLYSLNT